MASNEIMPTSTIASGEMRGAEILLKVVRRRDGSVAVVDGSNEEMVLCGPTGYMPGIANWIGDYLC